LEATLVRQMPMPMDPALYLERLVYAPARQRAEENACVFS
jgi:hypothetical protein